MSSNYVVSVPKLKGRENYAEWAFAVENFLMLEGTSDCILETKPEEAAADAKTKAKLILTLIRRFTYISRKSRVQRSCGINSNNYSMTRDLLGELVC
ncbi:unnamed protein product [Euphydryas editha]|uniref:Uncharacterized protein n=1 Tax=Euphydryas editha TaxID=104508 RepID=A0AAU9TPP9_EUPED|nr:unnamed protein product [Euphydryas editha]